MTIELNGSGDVEEKNFIDELIKTGKFTKDEAYSYIKKGMEYGLIYERKTGYFQKA